ncbi:MAG: phosphoribosylformylglycinamidine cyclo-ligase [Spirochaetales bacterium]|nr:phosphoribosylformylglycinamidine cyclo-ligase [Spirochaetales bacterium]
MGQRLPQSYKEAGVDKEEGYSAVQKMKSVVAATQNPHVLGGLGSFASLYSLQGYNEPVLVSGTDGVGTKLRLALDAKRYDVIGKDCYAMVANDVLCHGAHPLFFLDYLACGKLESDAAAGIVAGMAAYCAEEGCALVGGETAEMPGFYAPGDYDAAGFLVGAVEKSKMISGEGIGAGDVLIGLASSGAHSNGYSLIRALFSHQDWEKSFQGKPLRESFLEPTRLYGNPVRSLLDDGFPIKGMAHITGGGIPENLPRVWGHQPLRAVIQPKSWEEPLLFDLIRQQGVSEEEMRGTFNLGIGFVLVLPQGVQYSVLQKLESLGCPAWEIGTVEEGQGGVCFA